MSTARKWRASQKKKPWLRGQMEGAPREVWRIYCSFFAGTNPYKICHKKRGRLYSTRMNFNTFNLVRIFSRLCAIFVVVRRMSSHEFLMTWAQGGRPFSPKFVLSLNIKFGTLKLNVYRLNVLVIHCDAPSQLQLHLPCSNRSVKNWIYLIRIYFQPQRYQNWIYSC
jgi:hypothetical protein